MVEQTSHEAAQRGLKNVEVRQMDAEHLDFPDAEFDVVLCGFALFFFPQLERALAEFRRVLKPGGSLVVSTWGNQFENDREWFNELIKKYLPSQPSSGQKISASNEPDFTTSNGMEKLVRAAGFTDIFIDSEIAHFHYATKEEWWDTLWSHGVRGRLEAIEKTGGSEALEKLKAESFEQITARMDPKGFQHSFQVLYTCGRKPA
jgi:SAM-dependent methyltransferase